MKIAIYNPYMEVLGGGEKYICAIANTLSSEYEVDLFTHVHSLTKKQIEERLDESLEKVNLVYLPKFEEIQVSKDKDIFSRTVLRYKNRKFLGSDFQKNYDLFINITNNKPIICNAKRGILIVQFPFERIYDNNVLKGNYFIKILKKIYLNFELSSLLKSYDYIFVYSGFVKKWLKRLWKVDSIIVYPSIHTNCDERILDKKKNILSVGRFFIGGHCKKQDIMINVFKDLFDHGLKDWEYHLVGGISQYRKDQLYLEELKKSSQGYPVFFHVNIPFRQVQQHYKESSIFWHATGFGEDESANPEKMEHFGLTTVEAMSYGCIPVVINRGGQPEIINDKINGFLWNNLNELKIFTKNISDDPALLAELSRRAKERSKLFSRENFVNKVLSIVKKMQ